MISKEEQILEDYLKAASVWANTPRKRAVVIPSPQTEPKVKENIPTKTIIIGIGGLGGHAVSYFRQYSRYHVHSCSMDTTAKDLSNTQGTYRILLGKDELAGLGTGVNPEKSARLTQAILPEFERFLDLHEYAHVIVIAGAGGGTGSGAIPVIAKFLQQKKITHHLCLTMPFNFEGKSKTQIAHHTLQELHDSKLEAFTVDLQEMLESNPYASFKQALDSSLQSIMHEIEGQLEPVTIPSENYLGVVSL